MAGMFGIAAIAAAASLGQPTGASSPLRLSVEQDRGATIVRVVGLTTAPCSVGYSLEVADKGAGNRSVQRGTTNLQSGAEVILTTVRLNSAITNVAAKLTVMPDKSPGYEQTFGVSR